MRQEVHFEETDPTLTTMDEYLLDQVLESLRGYVLIQQTNLRGEVVLDGNELRIEKLKAMRDVKDILDEYIANQVRRTVADMVVEAAGRSMSLDESIMACQEDEPDVNEADEDHTEEEEIHDAMSSPHPVKGSWPRFVKN